MLACLLACMYGCSYVCNHVCIYVYGCIDIFIYVRMDEFLFVLVCLFRIINVFFFSFSLESYCFAYLSTRLIYLPGTDAESVGYEKDRIQLEERSSRRRRKALV